MDTSEIEMDAADRAKFARGGVFLLLGGLLVVAFGVLDVVPSAQLYAGLAGAALALAVAAVTSSEPMLRAIWFAPGVAAVGMAFSSAVPGGRLGAGIALAAVGVFQLVTAGLVRHS